MLPQWIISLEGGPRRVNHSAVVIDHKIYMFGGYCMGENYEEANPIDVHVLNTYSNRWTKIPTSLTFESDITQVPYMRYGHTSVAVGSKAYLWGGRNDAAHACNNLFSFDTNRLKWQKVKVKGNCPSARDGHGMCVCMGNVYIFGGFEEEANQFSNEMFKLELPCHIWCAVTYKSILVPCWRDFHSLTAIGQHMYVFGGRGDLSGPYHTNREIYDNTLQVFDTASGLWSQPVQADSLQPLGRRSHSAFSYKDSLYIFGGYNSVIRSHFNDLWKFDPESFSWSMARSIGAAPKPRRRQCCCIDEDKMYLFGGTSPATQSLDGLYPYDDDPYGYDEIALHDHSDLHVLDFCPSLETLCLLSVLRNNLDMDNVPAQVRWRARMMTTPGNITKSPSHHG